MFWGELLLIKPKKQLWLRRRRLQGRMDVVPALLGQKQDASLSAVVEGIHELSGEGGPPGPAER